MKGDYPRFRVSYIQEELVEHFLLTTTDHYLIPLFLSLRLLGACCSPYRASCRA
jgi:hypothetical protein